jgi:hypothetical protein
MATCRKPSPMCLLTTLFQPLPIMSLPKVKNVVVEVQGPRMNYLLIQQNSNTSSYHDVHPLSHTFNVKKPRLVNHTFYNSSIVYIVIQKTRATFNIQKIKIKKKKYKNLFKFFMNFWC